MANAHEVMVRHEPYRSRFLSRVAVASADECWLWTAAVSGTGYGGMGVGGRGVKTALTHRLAWLLWKGDIPLDICVLHSCDVKLCCNPGHLFLGTHKDNSDDKWAKGRDNTARYEAAGRAILNRQQVLEIRDKYVPWKYTHKRLAEEYGVARSTVRSITLGKSWVGVSLP